ncbi:uncharacterized protein OCT59_017145 [Rhizophagus irregularis]|uniref:uncharacterized protein n=1 Tax=Rhizophagus irregularis TaxID=588596 RepID=UPI003329458D|nr:hypothetical protein OCT59_017145 [Rhizophagus irregularis]
MYFSQQIADHESDDKWAGMENQESSVNTEATTVDKINISPIGNTQSRDKCSISESERPSLVNLKNLGYNILKSLDDETVGDIEFPELDSCSKCGNDILMSLSSACPASGCGKNVDILDQADALGIVSNLPIPDPKVTFQSSGISPLSNLMGTFTLSSPPIQMGGIEGPPKPLVYLTSKHIVHYNCIDNPRKLCPICPSTDMEIDDLETPTKQSSNTAQKKCFSEFASEKDSNKKAK